jgi:hypothetical protein
MNSSAKALATLSGGNNDNKRFKRNHQRITVRIGYESTEYIQYEYESLTQAILLCIVYAVIQKVRSLGLIGHD